MPDPAAVDRDAAARPEPFVRVLQGLLHELPKLVGERVELLALEVRRAGLALGRIVACLVAATILGVTAWLALWAMAVGLAVTAGLHWAAALGVAILVNAAVAALAVSRLRGQLSLLALPATRRHLSVQPAAPPAAPHAAATPPDPPVRKTGPAPTA